MVPGRIDAFTYDALPGRVRFGAGCVSERLAEEVARLAVHRVLLVSSAARRAAAERLAEPIRDRVVGVFDRARVHVPMDRVESGRTMAREVGADCLLCIGGGSTTGMAKAIALTSSVPIIAVPTTYAGSEMTPVWGITHHARKQTGRSIHVLPRVVLYDPRLTVAMPLSISGTSAINAMAHCVAGIFAAMKAPMIPVLAFEGIRALAAGIKAIADDPLDLDGRTQALYGAYVAGSVFAIVGSGLHHKFCHVLGGAYDLPHAETHTLLLPYTVGLYRTMFPEVVGRIGDALGDVDAPAGLWDLARRVGAPARLVDIGMNGADLEAATDLCVAAVPDDMPFPVSRADVRRLLAQALDGIRPT